MLEEVFLCKKCCFCIPLRYGLLTWIYIKLILTSFIFITLTISLYELYAFCFDCFILPIGIIILIIVFADIVLDIVFIVGGHLKNVRLLKLFHQYSFVMIVVTILLGVLSVALLAAIAPIGILLFINIIIYLSGLLIQTYFILLLRSEIIKLRSNCPYRFVKNAPESEFTVQNEEELAETKHVYDNEMS